MEITVSIKFNDGDAPDMFARLSALLAAAPLEAETEPEPSTPAAAEPRRRRRKDAAPVPAADPAVTPATGPPAEPLPEPSAEVVAFPTATPEPGGEVSAFDAILAAQEEATADTLTPDECRNGIKNLMIEHLGIVWARPNILQPYGHLSKVPDADLPALYAKAQADTLAIADTEVA